MDTSHPALTLPHVPKPRAAGFYQTRYGSQPVELSWEARADLADDHYRRLGVDQCPLFARDPDIQSTRTPDLTYSGFEKLKMSYDLHREGVTWVATERLPSREIRHQSDRELTTLFASSEDLLSRLPGRFRDLSADLE